MIEYLPQALSSLSAALNISKSFAGIRDSAKLQEAIMQFNGAIIDAQSKIISSQNEQTRLSSKIDELEKECVRMQNWETEKQKYSRREIATGVFAYIENDFMGNIQNAHKYCCNCFNKSIPSTLQQGQRQTHMRMTTLVCSNGCPELQFMDYSS